MEKEGREGRFEKKGKRKGLGRMKEATYRLTYRLIDLLREAANTLISIFRHGVLNKIYLFFQRLQKKKF